MADSIDGTPHRPTPVGTFCCRCDKPITGQAVRIDGFSASGARPDDWRHDSRSSRRRR